MFAVVIRLNLMNSGNAKFPSSGIFLRSYSLVKTNNEAQITLCSLSIARFHCKKGKTADT